MFRFILLLQIVSMIQCQYDFPWENNYDESNFIPEQQPSKSKSTSPDPQILPQPTKPQSIQPTKRAPLQWKSKQMHIVPTTGALFNIGPFKFSTLTFMHTCLLATL